MVLLLDPNDPQQCAYTDTTVASWLQTCAGGRRIHDLCFQNTSQSCLGGGGIPPLAIDAFKKHFCYPLERKIVSKASRERTWVGGATSGRTVPAAWAGSLLTIPPLEVAFAQRRGLSRRSRVVSATPCWEREGKAGLKPVKAVGQNSSYSAVIWNCLEDVIYFVLLWFQLV